jgi:hypothetical protein
MSEEIDYTAQNKTVIFDALKELGIEWLVVGYSGSGDSGQIDGMYLDDSYQTEANLTKEVGWAEVNRVYQPTSDGGWSPITTTTVKSSPLSELVEAFCYDALEEKHGGWENNDGGEGTFIFDVAEREVTWEHREFYTESNEYTYEL